MGQDEQTPSTLDVLNEQLAELQKEFQAGQQQITDVQTQIDKSTGDAETFKGQLTALEATQTELQIEIADVQTKIAAIPATTQTTGADQQQAAATTSTDAQTEATGTPPVDAQTQATTTETSTVVETETSQITITDIIELTDADAERVEKALAGKDARHVLHAIKPNFPNLKTHELSSVLLEMQNGLSFHPDIVTAIEKLPALEA
jgi:chromosome segregation ATPase